MRPETDRARAAVQAAARGCNGLFDVGEALTQVLSRHAQHDAWAMFAYDPMCGVRIEDAGVGGMMSISAARFTRNELGGRDRIQFADLARRQVPFGILGANAALDRRSERLHTMMAPAGFGSELRICLRDRGLLWGGLVLLRHDDVVPFTSQDARFSSEAATAVVPSLRALRHRSAATSPAPVPGVVLLGGDNEVRSATTSAHEWFARLDRAGNAVTTAPRIVHEVAYLSQATPCRATRQTPNGEWVTVSGSPLSDSEVAVTLASSTAEERLPAIAARSQLGPREQQIAHLLIEGTPTKTIARSLKISRHTVYFHLTNLYRKTGAVGREELFAQLTT